MVIAVFLLALAPTGTVVAGGPEDFMTVRMLDLKGTQREIGRQLAQAAVANHQIEPPTDPSALNKKRLEWQKQNWPENYQRSAGVRDFFNTPVKDLDPTGLPYDMELKPGCSVVFYPGKYTTSKAPTLSRNYDFPTLTYAELTGRPKPEGARAFTADPYVVRLHPTNGYASLYLCAYDLLAGCIDGVNEKGVAVALLADDMSPKSARRPGYGLMETSLTRFVLDRCASAKEARKLLKDIPYNYTFTPCHYMICDSTGDSFIWETEADRSRQYMVSGGGKPQVVTNHLVAKYPNPKEANNSFDRWNRMETEIGKRPKLSEKDIEYVNSCVAVPRQASIAATLWHSMYDLKARSMKVSFYLGKNSDGSIRRTKYLSFRL